MKVQNGSETAATKSARFERDREIAETKKPARKLALIKITLRITQCSNSLIERWVAHQQLSHGTFTIDTERHHRTFQLWFVAHFQTFQRRNHLVFTDQLRRARIGMKLTLAA